METPRPSTVVVVDDEKGVCDYLAGVLQFEGYRCQCFRESSKALSYLSEQNQPADLLLADIRMPEMDGITLLREAKSLNPRLPVILISGLYELALALEALDAGADDYLKKPVRPVDVVTLVAQYLQPDIHNEDAVRQALQEFVEALHANGTAMPQLKTVFQKLGFKRYETLQHSKRVAAYCRLFGAYCGLSEETLRHIELGALLHDIGKIGIPHNVLMKPGSLTEEEWRVIRTHPEIGYGLLSQFPSLSEEAGIVLSHHERFDGLGYPKGLTGDEIPLGARIFSIVDTFDAITAERPYRPAQSIQAALNEIADKKGTQFDPALVEVFLKIPVEELQAIRERYPDPTGEQLASNLVN